MCFVHVLRNVEKRPFASKNNKSLIIDDIKKMQLAPNQATFQMMATLFKQKWKECEPNYVDYFENEWLGRLHVVKESLQKNQMLREKLY